MSPARVVFHRLAIVVALVGAFASSAAASPAPADDSRAPTSLEVALAGYACGPQNAAVNAGHFDCVSAGVAALRADFGYNLTRLTAAQRTAIDRACGPRRTSEGHDAYLACVNSRLAPLRTKKPESVSAAASKPPAASPPIAESRDDAAVPEPPTADAGPSPRRASSASLLPLAGIIAAIVAVLGGMHVAKRLKAARHTCRTCGRVVPSTADLCPDCRKQAAEALRHAASERAERERAVANNAPTLALLQEQQRARDEADAQLRLKGEELRRRAREAENARASEQTRLDVAVERTAAADPLLGGEDVFDPYVTLGIPPGAGPAVIAAAYKQARSKYDLNTVDFLGDDVRSYYKTKADAVERAYRELTRETASPEAAVPRI